MFTQLISNLYSHVFIASGISDFFQNTIYDSFLNLCMAVDSVIYSIISWLYTIFIAIAEARIFTTETIMSFIDRVYLIIGIIGLFFAAYMFLTIIINPDNISKGNSSPSKLIGNVVKGIIAIVFIPTIFNFAYSVQQSVIDNNVIPRLFFSSTSADLEQSEYSFNEFGVNLFEGSFYVKDVNDTALTQVYGIARQDAIRYNDVKQFSTLMTYVKQGKIQYNFIVSGIIGLALLIILISYCTDIAVRSVKLAFLQIIAPFPSLLLMVPGQEKAFKKWLSETLKAFFEVFAKIALLVFGIFLIQKLQVFFEANKATLFKNFSVDVIVFTRLFLIMGVIIFLRKAPKLLEEIFGFKANNPLNLKSRLDDAGITAVVGATGGAIAGAYSSVKGAKARGGNQGWAAVSGVFHGARLGGESGWKGSLKGIGNAYNYGWANQQAWSHMDPERGFVRNGVRVAGEMLRDNFGMQSYYEDLIDQARIKHDVQVSRNNRKIQIFENEQNQKARELENEYKYDERNAANENFNSFAKKSSETTKSEILKDDGVTFALVPEKEFDPTDPDHKKYVIKIKRKEVRGSQIDSLRNMATEHLNNHSIDIDQHKYIMESLDKAEKILGINYDSKTLLSGKRDAGFFDKLTNIGQMGSGIDTKADAIYRSFVESFNENMKQGLFFNPDTNTYTEFSDLKESEQEAIAAREEWGKKAKDLFDKIVFTQKGKYKTNIAHYNELMGILDQASLSNGPVGDKGYVRDAAGQTFDKETGTFVIDEAVKKVSENIGDIVSGYDISKAVKAVKNKDVIGERNAKYRSTNVTIGEDTYNMAQIQQIVKSLRDENAKLAKELETVQLAYQSDKQTSEAARKIGSLNKPGGKK